jgi:GAF domain-containing protein/ligand-binding sensor domain-containing protein
VLRRCTHRLVQNLVLLMLILFAFVPTARFGLYALTPFTPRVVHLPTASTLAQTMAQEAPQAQRPPGQELRFERISVEQGLSDSTVTCFYQDSAGFLWIGTNDGLNRYDGYDFQVYRHDPGDPTSLSHDSVTAILEDSSGVLWIGTAGGLDWFDRRQERFVHYRHDADDPVSLSHDAVSVLYQDRSGTLWVGTWGGGLNRLNPTTGRFVHYQHDPTDVRSLSHDAVAAIYQDRSGVLWVGTVGGLNRMGPGMGSFTRYTHNPEDPRSVGDDLVRSILEDQYGVLWLGTGGGGLNQFNRYADTFTRYLVDPEDVEGFAYNDVVAILEDSAGVLWVGTDGGGLNQFDRQTARFTVYQTDPQHSNSLSGNQITALYEDREEVLWVGTLGGGISKHDRSTQRFAHYQKDPENPNSLSHSRVLSLFEDPEGVLWIGTDGKGLDRFDRKQGTFRNVRNDPDDLSSLGGNYVSGVAMDQEGILWVGTWGAGLDRFDAGTDTFVHYRHDPDDPRSLSHDTVWPIYVDHLGVLWIGTAGGGLNRLDVSGAGFVRYQHDPDNPRSLSDDTVSAIFEDSDGELWIGTHSGLNRFDREAEQFDRYVYGPEDPANQARNVVYAMDEDAAGAFWLATAGGLARFDRTDEVVTYYTEQDGLPSARVTCALMDEAGFLWVSTTKGLSRFDPRTQTFRTYGVSDGVQGYLFTVGACDRSRSGEMFFGGAHGFNVFDPGDVQDNPHVPPVVLTSLTQGGEEIDLGRSLQSVRDVDLRWPNTHFEFEYAALGYRQPEKNQYAYLLEGFEADWNYVGTRRFGQYTNLRGGTYTLRVKGSNNDGLWNEEGISLQIRVTPPFWQTWWFRGAAALVLLAGAATGFRLRVRGMEARRRALEAQVASRTKELAALNTIANAVSSSFDLEQTLARALDTTLEVTGLDAGGIYLLQTGACPKGGDLLTIATHKGLSSRFVQGIDNLLVGEGFSGRVAETGEPLAVQDLATDTRLTRSVVRESGFSSLAIAPLVSRGEVLGTLFVCSRDRAEFTPQKLELLTSIGGQVGVAIENAQFFEGEQRRAEQFRIISEVGQQITSILEVDQLLAELVRAIRDTFGYYMVGIGLIEGDEVVVRAASWGDGEGADAQGYRIPVGEGITGWVASTGHPLRVPDVRQDPRYVRLPAAEETCSELAVPLVGPSGVLGVMNVESDRRNDFDGSDLIVLQALANQAAIAIENAHFFEAEQRRAEQFRVIAEVGRRISLTPTVEDALVQLVDLVRQAFGYYHVGIGLIEGGEVVYRVGAGALWEGEPFAGEPARLQVGQEGLSGWVAATGKPLLVPDVSQEPRYLWMAPSKTQSELTVPIMVKGKVIGVFDVQSDRLNAFDDTDLAVIQSLAHQAGAAIENARLYEQAQQAAVTEERQRLARELHDAVTQTLFSASLMAEALPASWEKDPEEGRQLVWMLRQLSRGALAEMRTLLMELRPASLVEANLDDLIRQLAEAVTGREGVPVRVVVEGACDLPEDVHVAFYRIAQEALNNVAKHARAEQVEVYLRCEPPSDGEDDAEGSERLTLSVVDDGGGFDPERVSQDHLGLGIMRERARAVGAALTIDSQPGQGTRIIVVWKRGRGKAVGDG